MVSKITDDIIYKVRTSAARLPHRLQADLSYYSTAGVMHSMSPSKDLLPLHGSLFAHVHWLVTPAFVRCHRVVLVRLRWHARRCVVCQGHLVQPKTQVS